jgi:alkylated DNA repair protein (DNA oxidative demethylase)
MQTRGGHRLSVAMSNCGTAGRITDHRGYRYDSIDPPTGLPWPAIPALLHELAVGAAQRADRVGFARPAGNVPVRRPRAIDATVTCAAAARG